MTNEEICAWLKAEAEPKFQKFTSGLIPGTEFYTKDGLTCLNG